MSSPYVSGAPRIITRDGRAIAFFPGGPPSGADWGRVYNPGDPLPCCGCASGHGSLVKKSKCECRCHDVARFVFDVPAGEQ